MDIQLFYVCLHCFSIAAGHPIRDPIDECENCGETASLWTAVLLERVIKDEEE